MIKRFFYLFISVFIVVVPSLFAITTIDNIVAKEEVIQRAKFIVPIETNLQGILLKEKPVIGDIYETHQLHEDSDYTKGMAFDESDSANPKLYVLDASKFVVVYSWSSSQKALTYVERIDLAKINNLKPLDPRGLAIKYENGKQYFYFLEWDATNSKGYLWKQDVALNSAERAELTNQKFKTYGRELNSLTIKDNQVYITFDTSVATDNVEKMRKGMISFQVAGSNATSVSLPTTTAKTVAPIIKIAWAQVKAGTPLNFREMPISGDGASRGLAYMDFDGNPYLWGASNSDYVYLIDEPSGRGIFTIPTPKPAKAGKTFWGLAFGSRSLWVAERLESGANQVHRVNVRDNIYEPYTGPKQLRRLKLQVETNSTGSTFTSGKYVYHNYSRPFASEVVGNQGRWPQTETTVNLTSGKSPTITNKSMNPGNDPDTTQYYTEVKYNAVQGSMKSEYGIDLWSRDHQFRVYPHLATSDKTPLGNADYLSDDNTLYNLDDTTAYSSFVTRVKTYIESQYSGGARMNNPYWLARNVVEYMIENYHYPIDEDDDGNPYHPATVDYANGHYNANPANMKLNLSLPPHTGDEIVPCSPSSVMLAGVMRYKGVPARWIGTGDEQGYQYWDMDGNKNGLLEEGEESTSTNGHRFAQIWLGPNYGWQKFDGTPYTPADEDFSKVPLKASQLDIIEKSVALNDAGRIIYNIQSHKFTPMFKEYEFTSTCAAESDCGGDQRYNLQGRFDVPSQWKGSGHTLKFTNLLFVKNVHQSKKMIGGIKYTISWELDGKWEEDADATLDIELVQKNSDGTYTSKGFLAIGIPTSQTTEEVNLSDFPSGDYAIKVVKTGDSKTGGMTSVFTHAPLIGVELDDLP